MSKRNDGQPRGKYTLEFKLEAVRLVKGGQAVPVTAKILGVPVQALGNWVRFGEKGQLKGAGDKPVSAEQMELARLRAENARAFSRACCVECAVGDHEMLLVPDFMVQTVRRDTSSVEDVCRMLCTDLIKGQRHEERRDLFLKLEKESAAGLRCETSA